MKDKVFRETSDGWFNFYINKSGEKKLELDIDDMLVDDLNKPLVRFWGVEQSHYGHIYRYIFTDKALREELKDCSVKDDILSRNYSTADILWPMGGSNSSATYFFPCNTGEDAKTFLTMEVEVDCDDPELVDLSEGIMTIELEEGIAKDFVEKYNIPLDVRYDNRYFEAKEMIDALKEAGYANLDYDNTFYGANKDMRFSELEEIYEREVASKGSDDMEI